MNKPSEIKTALEQFPKSVKADPGKNCGKNKELEQFVDCPSEEKTTLDEHVTHLLATTKQEAARNRRLVLIFSAFSLFCAVVALIFYALGDSVSYYKIPSSLSQSDREAGSRLRLGGFVVAGSLEQHGSEMSFLLSDDVAAEKIHFQGIVPDLFREEQAVIVEGKFEEKAGFVAYRLLAKHDARYISPERVEMLKKQGKWQEYLQE